MKTILKLLIISVVLFASCRSTRPSITFIGFNEPKVIHDTVYLNSSLHEGGSMYDGIPDSNFIYHFGGDANIIYTTYPPTSGTENITPNWINVGMESIKMNDLIIKHYEPLIDHEIDSLQKLRYNEETSRRLNDMQRNGNIYYLTLPDPCITNSFFNPAIDTYDKWVKNANKIPVNKELK